MTWMRRWRTFEVWVATHRLHRCRRSRRRGAILGRGRQRDCAAQRLDAVRRRRRVRDGCRDRHQHGQVSRPRSGGSGAAHQLQISGARQRTDPRLIAPAGPGGYSIASHGRLKRIAQVITPTML